MNAADFSTMLMTLDKRESTPFLGRETLAFRTSHDY